MNSTFIIYMVGVAILTGGLAFAAHEMGVSNTWIGAGIAIVIGLGIMGAATKARRRDDSLKK